MRYYVLKSDVNLYSLATQSTYWLNVLWCQAMTVESTSMHTFAWFNFTFEILVLSVGISATSTPRTVYGSRSFSVAAPTLWYSLPADITNAASLTAFRNRLKTFLFHHILPVAAQLTSPTVKRLWIFGLLMVLYKLVFLT